MDDGSEVQTNMVAYNLSYGVDEYDVNSNNNDNNNIHLRAVLNLNFLLTTRQYQYHSY
jgi:hypothetical protein